VESNAYSNFIPNGPTGFPNPAKRPCKESKLHKVPCLITESTNEKRSTYHQTSHSNVKDRIAIRFPNSRRDYRPEMPKLSLHTTFAYTNAALAMSPQHHSIHTR
jgi:hypothetical protein